MSKTAIPELVEAIKQHRWQQLTTLTPRQRALCAVAEKMTRTPREMTAADWQPLRDAGFNDEGLLEIGHVVAIFSYFPHMADGFGLTPDPRVLEAGRTGVALQRVG